MASPLEASILTDGFSLVHVLTSGGGGTGGCILTGPYEPMIMPKDDFSDESFESTEESDAALDITGPVGLTHNNFSNTEVVWAKRPALPWFPGIVSFHHLSPSSFALKTLPD